jgi:hypothetical protein
MKILETSYERVHNRLMLKGNKETQHRSDIGTELESFVTARPIYWQE